MKPPRIFIGLRELGGYYGNLKEGFDTLGIPAVFVDLSGHPFQYPNEGNPPVVRWINRLSQAAGRFFFSRWILRLLWTGVIQNLFGFFLFFWAVRSFDVFIFASNSSFFFFLDLPILRLLRKKIVYVMHGSESRPVYLNGYVMARDTWPAAVTGLVLARIQKGMVSWIDRFADAVVTIPPQAHFHGRPCVSWLSMGIPQQVKVQPGDPEAGPHQAVVRILHAPSKPLPKGTPEIRRAVSALKQKGYAIDYREITGRPHAEVLAELARCDFIIDERYSDTPMAVFATEAAFYRKPAVVGSYYAESIRRDVAEENIPPSLFCLPGRMEEAIERLVADGAFRRDLGERAYDFVTSRWSAGGVAARYLILIEGKAPAAWFFDPHAIRYLHGCGLPEAKARGIVGRLIRLGGKGALCLSDKPVLEDLFIRFAGATAEP